MVESSDNPTYTILDMPEGERPRERLMKYGAEALSNAELLAILLRTGIKGENVLNLSNRLLTMHGGLLGLVKARFSEVAQIKGLGPAKTCQLKAALELGRRLVIASPNQLPQITSPSDVANLLMLDMAHLTQEHLRVLLLDSKNHVLASPTVYIGNVNSSIIRPAEVFREAICENAPAIILVHNHPSGDPTPSHEDVNITKRLLNLGEQLSIKLLDHVIIGKQTYVSLKEKGVFSD